MSKKSCIVEIDPPKMCTSKAGEVFKFRGFACPHCDGEGGFYKGGYSEKFKASLDDPDWVGCKVCGGTGELEANVVVGWVACGKVKEQFKNKDHE